MSPIASLFRNRMRHSIEPFQPRSNEPDWADHARADAVMLGATWLFSGLALPTRSKTRR